MVGIRQLMNEYLITINKKLNRLQKPASQQKEEEEEERECLSAPYSNKLSLGGKGVILMQSENVWEVAGVSFVDKLFCLGMEPVYRI